MLDGVNALIESIGLIWQALFDAPLYGALTWGYFLVSVAAIGILVSFFIGRLK